MNAIVTKDLDVTITVDGDVTLDVAAGATVTLNGASAVNTGDWTVTGSGKIKAELLDVSGAKFKAHDATLSVITTGTIDLEDIDVAKLDVGVAAAVTATTVEGKALSISKAGGLLLADTSDAHGSFSVSVNADNVGLDIGDRNTGTNVANFSSATVNVNAVSGVVDNMQGLFVNGTVDMNISGAKYTIDAIVDDSASATSTINFTGDQALTVTESAAGVLNAAGYTGAVTITEYTNDGAMINTGSAADTVTLAEDISATVSTGAGNDVVDGSAYVGDTDKGAVVNLGSGDDTYKTTGTLTSAGGALVIDGGDGNDTIDFSKGVFDGGSFSAMTISNVETMKIGAGANVFLTKALSGVTGMTIVGTSADDDQVSISTTTSDASINLSGVTYDATVDESTIDLGHNKADTAFVGTLSNIADTVVGVDGNTKAFTLNLGAGDDEIMLGDNAGTLTLGVGKDNIMLTTGATTSTAGDMVSVADFTLADDKITKVAADIGADKVVDVSGESDDTATDIVANALNGVITISGTHATQIDTLAEWVKVVLAVSGADTAADEVYAFQYNGNTYVTETKGGTGSAEEVTIELTGVTGITALGVAAAAHTIVIA